VFTQEHLRCCKEYDDNVSLHLVLRKPWFWAEALMCLAHLPVFVTGEVSAEFLGNLIVYRYESIACVVAVLRLYLLWRSIVDKFVAELPDCKLSISTYNGVRFDSAFFLKKLLNSWLAIEFIICIYFLVALLGGYLFRLAEASSCELTYATHPDCLLPNAKVWTINGIAFDKVCIFRYVHV